MSRVLVDTNILIRTLQPHHPSFPSADNAVQRLAALGGDLVVTSQNLIELWAVATRGREHNGLGMTIADAATELDRIKSIFVLLPDTPAIYSVWEGLVRGHLVSGKPSHDARLVAAMQVHGVPAILTFDRTGFSRFPGIEVLDPADLVGASRAGE